MSWNEMQERAARPTDDEIESLRAAVREPALSLATENQRLKARVEHLENTIRPVRSAVLQSADIGKDGDDSYDLNYHIEITITIGEARAIRAAINDIEESQHDDRN